MEDFLEEECGGEEEPPSSITTEVLVHSQQLKLEDYVELGRKEIAKVISEVIGNNNAFSKVSSELSHTLEEAAEKTSLEQEVAEGNVDLHFEDYTEMPEEVSKVIYGLMEKGNDFTNYDLFFLTEIQGLIGDVYRDTLYMKGDESGNYAPIEREKQLVDDQVDISAHLQDRALDKKSPLYTDISEWNTEDRSEEQKAWQTFMNKFEARMIEMGIRSYFQQIGVGSYN